MTAPGWLHRNRVLLFRRILSFKPETVAAQEHRRSQRYAVGEDFALKAVLVTAGRDADGEPLKPSDGRGRPWGCQVVNLSSTGLNVRVSASLYAARGDACTVTLKLERYEIELPGELAHFRAGREIATCGVALRFDEFTQQKAYLQMLEAVSIGASLKPVPAAKVLQDSPGFRKFQFAGQGDELLSVWQADGYPVPSAFEFRFHDHYVRGAPGEPLKVYGREDGGEGPIGYSMPALNLSAIHAAEVRRLFGWIVPNLSAEVPAQVRGLLAEFLPAK